jgi:hypothetical protein
VPIDKWAIMDAIVGVFNILAVNIIRKVQDDYVVYDQTTKFAMDYFMIFVIVFTWMRFFLLFLLFRSISKLLLTLLEMIGDT